MNVFKIMLDDKFSVSRYMFPQGYFFLFLSVFLICNAFSKRVVMSVLESCSQSDWSLSQFLFCRSPSLCEASLTVRCYLFYSWMEKAQRKNTITRLVLKPRPLGPESNASTILPPPMQVQSHLDYLSWWYCFRYNVHIFPGTNS